MTPPPSVSEPGAPPPVFPPPSTDVLHELCRLQREGARAALVTVVRAEGHTPRGPAAKMVVLEDGSIVGTIGGGRIEHEICRDAQDVIAKGFPRVVRYHLTQELGMCCGGEMECFIEPVRPAPRLLIFGGGHVGLALAHVAPSVGFRIWVVDELIEYANPERFPMAERIVNSFAEPALQALEVTDRDYLVLVTREHRMDQRLLEYFVTRPRRYLGMIGSLRKVEKFYARMKAKGFDPALFARVRAPIGLDLGGETPEEIAISILAELIQVKNRAPAQAPLA